MNSGDNSLSSEEDDDDDPLQPGGFIDDGLGDWDEDNGGDNGVRV